MRLLVDCHCFDYGDAQGINTYIKELYKALIPIAKDITFIFAAQNIELIKRIFGNSSNIEYIKLGKHSKYYRLAVEFPILIRKYKIDYAHFQYTAPLIKTCKTIITLHDILFEDFPEEFPLSYKISKHILFKKSSKKADILLTVSEYSKERISKLYNIPLNDIYITHNGVNDDYKHLDKNQSRDFIKSKYGFDKYLLYVSRFEPRKNQQAILRAYINLKLHTKGYELVLIGIKSIECPEFDDLYKACDDDIKEHIHIYSNIPYSELIIWYSGAELFIYPSKAEGFGIPPLEAAACCVPVICNNQTAMRDFSFFKPNHIDTNNQYDLEEGIIQILNDKVSQLVLTDIQNVVFQKYSWDNIAKEYYKILSLNV